MHTTKPQAPVLWDIRWDADTQRFRVDVTDGDRLWTHWAASHAAGVQLARALSVTMLTGKRLIDGRGGRSRPVRPDYPLHGHFDRKRTA